MNSKRIVSSAAFIIIYALLALAILALTENYSQTRFRINRHEEAHLRAYAEDDVYAYRESFRNVRSARLTLNGALAGYEQDVHIITMFSIAGAIAVFLLYLFFPSPLWSVIMMVPVGMWRSIYNETVNGAPDLANAVKVGGMTEYYWFLEVVMPPGFIIIGLAIAAFVLTSVIWLNSKDGKVPLTPSSP